MLTNNSALVIPRQSIIFIRHFIHNLRLKIKIFKIQSTIPFWNIIDRFTFVSHADISFPNYDYQFPFPDTLSTIDPRQFTPWHLIPLLKHVIPQVRLSIPQNDISSPATSFHPLPRHFIPCHVISSPGPKLDDRSPEGWFPKKRSLSWS